MPCKSTRRPTSGAHWMRLALMVASLGILVASNATAVDSMSNRVIKVEVLGDGKLLLVQLATGIQHTRGAGGDPTKDIISTCSRNDTVVVRLDAATPAESMEVKLIRQAIEAARIGPLRIQFTVAPVVECVTVPERAPTTFPVATGVVLLQTKEVR